MSAASDKARFFLERSVPELQECLRKKIFTPAEISSIARKRSDFEHSINARGSTPALYASYAEFEINVDALRRKRVKRLGVKGTLHTGQRRVFFVFDRGLRKFPGDLALWMQGIEYARGQKSFKKVGVMLTGALRLHPARSELWIYAARFALEELGDVTEARGYMQRGLRFCRARKEMWVMDFRLEVGWIVKVWARRRVLGIEGARGEEEVKRLGENEGEEDVLMVPTVTEEDVAPEDEKGDKIDVTALENLDATPIMSGAIPIAVFDAAMKQFEDDVDLAWNFQEECDGFEDIPAIERISNHIDEILQRIDSTAWQACASHVVVVVKSIRVDDHRFPGALREAFSRISAGLTKTKQREDFLTWSRGFLGGLLKGEMDSALQLVLQSKLQSLV